MLLSACGALTSMEADKDPEARSRYARTRDLQLEVDSLVKPIIAHGETPGMVVGVMLEDGSQHFFSYGDGEKEGGPLTPDSLFPVGSLSKGYLGALLTVLVDEGRFSWNDTLPTLLPPSTPLSRDAEKITLLQLATHTSGLPRQPFDFRMFRNLARFTFTGENFYSHFDNDYLMQYLAGYKAPGTITPQYSNIGYAVLSTVIEARMHEKLDVLLEEKVLKPLALRNTAYRAELLPAGRHLAQGHAGDQPKFMRRGTPVDDWQFTGGMKGSAGIYTNARDLLAFAAAHLPQHYPSRLHDLLADNLRVRFPQKEDAPGIAWVTDEFDELPITNQVGVTVGHTSYVGIDVRHGTAVVVLQNSFNWNYKVGHKLLWRMAQAQEPLALR